MKIYDLTVLLKKHGETEIEVEKCKIILSNNEDVKESVNMIYGSFYDIMSYEYKECDTIYISKKYLIEQDFKIVHFE